MVLAALRRTSRLPQLCRVAVSHRIARFVQVAQIPVAFTIHTSRLLSRMIRVWKSGNISICTRFQVRGLMQGRPNVQPNIKLSYFSRTKFSSTTRTKFSGGKGLGSRACVRV